MHIFEFCGDFGIAHDAALFSAFFERFFKRKSAPESVTVRSAAGFVRRELSSSMHIRTVPEFTFMLDKQAEYGEKIDKLLDEIKKKEKENDENA